MWLAELIIYDQLMKLNFLSWPNRSNMITWKYEFSSKWLKKHQCSNWSPNTLYLRNNTQNSRLVRLLWWVWQGKPKSSLLPNNDRLDSAIMIKLSIQVRPRYSIIEELGRSTCVKGRRQRCLVKGDVKLFHFVLVCSLTGWVIDRYFW